MRRYRELIVKGDDRDLIPYLAGFLSAKNVSGVYFAEESGLHVRELRERFRHHGEVQHIVCMEESVVAVRDALARAVPRYRFEIKEEREVARARFRFELETPSRNVAQLVKDTLAGLPPQTTLSGFEPRERINRDSTGAELYSPTHDYEFQASGEVQGDIDGVIKMRQRLCTIEFVKCHEVDLLED
jgi:hypothetical protein